MSPPSRRATAAPDSQGKGDMVQRLVFTVLATATLGLLAVMLFWSLPHLGPATEGRVFDLRFTGYGHDEAVAYLKALGPAGRAFYDEVQLQLDTAFPILYLATLSALLGAILDWAGFTGRVRLFVAFVVVAIPTLFDFAENAAIREMLHLDPAAVGPELVARASFDTTMKWATAAIGLAVAAGGVAFAVVRHLRGRES